MSSYDAVFPESLCIADAMPTEEWWAWRDAQIRIHRYRRPGASATLILLHGGGAHGRLLAPYGRRAAEAGFDAVMPDLPGYGWTKAPAAMVRYDRWVECVADLVRRERETRPVVVIGASLGGMLAWHAAATLPAGTVEHVLATTLIDARRREVRRTIARFGPVGVLGVPLLTATSRVTDGLRLPMPWLGKVSTIANDPAVVRAVVRDRRGGGNRVPLGFLRSWMTYEPALEPEQWDRAPVTLAHPGDDRWTPTALSLDFFGRLPEPKRFVTLPNCGHLPLEEPGLSVLHDEIVRLSEALSSRARSGRYQRDATRQSSSSAGGAASRSLDSSA
jgi:alpha-beta hydrolase superfamily lysophospholipase